MKPLPFLQNSNGTVEKFLCLTKKTFLKFWILSKKFESDFFPLKTRTLVSTVGIKVEKLTAVIN